MSKEKQQTAVEWFSEQMYHVVKYMSDEAKEDFKTIVEQAKEMEEKQIKIAYSYGVAHFANGIRNVDCNKYYKEKYGK